MTTEGINIRGYVLEVYRDPEDGSWVADVPDLPGCVAAGESPTEAIELAEDAIAAWIESAQADGRPIPGPRPVEDEYSGRYLQRLPKSLHRRLAAQAKREGVSLNTYCVMALAESLGLASGRGSLTARDTPSVPAQFTYWSGEGASLRRVAEGYWAHTTSGTELVAVDLAGRPQLPAPKERRI